MRSVKKPALLLALVAVVALALPAVAGASKIESKKGVLASVGSKITATNSGLVVFGGFGYCGTMQMYEKLTKNNGNTFEGISHSPGTATSCTTNEKVLTVREPRFDNIVSTTSGTGTVSMSFEVKLPETNCHYSGTLPFTYKLGSNEIALSSTKLQHSPIGPCPYLSLSGTFALTIGATPVILN